MSGVGKSEVVKVPFGFGGEQSGVEKFMVERFMVEESGVERSRVDAWG